MTVIVLDKNLPVKCVLDMPSGSMCWQSGKVVYVVTDERMSDRVTLVNLATGAKLTVGPNATGIQAGRKIVSVKGTTRVSLSTLGAATCFVLDSNVPWLKAVDYRRDDVFACVNLLNGKMTTMDATTLVTPAEVTIEVDLTNAARTNDI